MELSFSNHVINILASSIFMLSFMECLPQPDNDSNVMNKKSIRFPEPFLENQDYSIYSDDHLESIADKIIRSPVSSVWASEAQKLLEMATDHNIKIRSESNKVNGAPDEIVFPDQPGTNQKPTKKVNFVPVISGIPPCAQGKPYCEDAENYPRSHMKNVLQKEVKYHTYFGKDVIPEEGIKNRDSADGGWFPLCKTRETVIYPKMGENKDGKWLFIANVDNYIQGVRIELCGEQVGSACDKRVSLPPGYDGVCQQNYIYRKLVALDDSGNTISEPFRLPSCCSCKMKFVGISDRSLSSNTSMDEPMSSNRMAKEGENKPANLRVNNSG